MKFVSINLPIIAAIVEHHPYLLVSIPKIKFTPELSQSIFT